MPKRLTASPAPALPSNLLKEEVTMNTVAQIPPAAQPGAARVVASLEWDDVAAGRFPATGVNGLPDFASAQRWHDAVRRAGAVIANHPDFVPEPGRFRTALDLGAVTLHADGTAAVRSGTHTYELAPDCPCKDAETVSKYCKHYLATLIVREASGPLQPAAAPVAPVPPNGKVVPMIDTEPAPAALTPAPDPFPPSTLCLKARVGNVELSWTLRGADEDVAARSKRVLKFVDALASTHREPAPALPDPAPASAPQCPLHGAAKVKPSTLFAGWYCTARVQDGYCKWTQKTA
jgi:hypothetical protein